MPGPRDLDAPVSVRDNPAEGRFEVLVGEEVVGIALYGDDGDVRTFTHTEVDDRFAGHGLAGRLVRTALDTTRAAGRHVRPVCPYVRTFIAEHADYADLVVP